MNLATELASYVHSVNYRDIPEKVLHETKKRVIDSLGCAIGAFEAEPVKASRKVAEAVVAREGGTMFGTRRRTAPDLAAFVNGTTPTFPRSPLTLATTSDHVSQLLSPMGRLEGTCFCQLFLPMRFSAGCVTLLIFGTGDGITYATVSPPPRLRRAGSWV